MRPGKIGLAFQGFKEKIEPLPPTSSYLCLIGRVCNGRVEKNLVGVGKSIRWLAKWMVNRFGGREDN